MTTIVGIPEKCRVCSCTETAPCVIEDQHGRAITCSWLDFDHTLCTNKRCIAEVPLEVLLELTVMRRPARRVR